MKLPEKLEMRNIIMGDGAKGMAFQVARNDEFGVEQQRTGWGGWLPSRKLVYAQRAQVHHPRSTEEGGNA